MKSLAIDIKCSNEKFEISKALSVNSLRITKFCLRMLDGDIRLLSPGFKNATIKTVMRTEMKPDMQKDVRTNEVTNIRTNRNLNQKSTTQMVPTNQILSSISQNTNFILTQHIRIGINSG